MSFPTRIYGKPGWEKQTYTAAKGRKLGTIMELPDGRLFRFAFSGEAIATSGNLLMQKDISNASHDTDLVVTAAVALGGTTVALTNAGAPVTKDQFADGYLYINDAAAEGQMYIVKANGAATTTGAISVTLDEEDGIQGTALTTSSEVGLRENLYKDVEIWDANDIDGIPVGWNVTPVGDNEYFWCQVHGVVAALFDSDDNAVLGRSVIPSPSVDGAVRSYDAAATTTVINQIVGHAMVASVDTERTLVFATIE